MEDFFYVTKRVRTVKRGLESLPHHLEPHLWEQIFEYADQPDACLFELFIEAPYFLEIVNRVYRNRMLGATQPSATPPPNSPAYSSSPAYIPAGYDD